MTRSATAEALTLLRAALRANPVDLPAAMAAVWEAAQGHHCRRCHEPIRLSPGAGDPYWWHPATRSVWCDGWADPDDTGRKAAP